jgi:hypothetical protein
MTAADVYNHIALQDNTPTLTTSIQIEIRALSNKQLCDLRSRVECGDINYPFQRARNHLALQVVTLEMAGRFIAQALAPE